METTARIVMGLFVFAGAVGCASVQLPQEQVDHYEASVREAKVIGAFKGPADGEHAVLGMSPAKAHLVMADSEIAVAREMAARGDQRAPLLLARAQSDVDLAVGLAREAARHSQRGVPGSPRGFRP